MRKKKTKSAAAPVHFKPPSNHKALDVSKLRWQCEPKSLGVKTTDDVVPSRAIIGQERALRALRVGLEMHHFGYNIFVTGLGTGRTTTIKRLLKDFEKNKVELKDYCYVYNFKNPDMPISLALPAGQGKSLQQDMESLIKDLLVNIPGLYESQRYQDARKTTIEHFQDRQKSVLQDFEKRVKEKGFDLVQVQVGNAMRPDVVPVVGGNPINLDQAEGLVQKGELNKEQFEVMKETQAQLDKQMATVFRELRTIERKVQQSIEDLEERLVMPIVDEGIDVLKATYGHVKVHTYLDEVRSSVRENLGRFRRTQQSPLQQEEQQQEDEGEDEFVEYQVNVLVDNAETDTIPIIIETNPKYKNIFGTLDRELEKGGVWRTDFMHIKAGSLLRADGGYLVLNALDTLIEPWAWQDLKRTLRTEKMEIHTYEPTFGFSATSMKPEAIALNVKVIMIGDAEIYQLLYFRDDDFKKIFKIRADFDSEMPKNKDSLTQYVHFLKMICDDEKLKPFDATALAQIIEYGVRLSGQQKKISTRFNMIADIAREANYWATKANVPVVLGEHIEKAIEERIYRVRLVEDKIQEMITEGTFMIDTDGSAVGQVNGLTIYDLAEHAFGKPSRITAKTALGRSGVINIEREAELSGPTHNKGIAILTGYLRSKFAQRRPLIMDASVTFEQSYGGVDGDSASSTEVYAILSSLSEIPLRQDIAVTGSVNQKGEIQPIGGVNLKVEGFYDACKSKGLTGAQGVMIPTSNVNDLMLREDIIEQVKKRKFQIYAVDTIDEGIEILTGVKAGIRRAGDSFEPGTVYHFVDRKLQQFAEDWKAFERGK